MALDIQTIRKAAQAGGYVSDRRLFLTAEGELVDERDPRAETLLVGEGGTLPDEVARRHGLILSPDELPVSPETPASDESAAALVSDYVARLDELEAENGGLAKQLEEQKAEAAQHAGTAEALRSSMATLETENGALRDELASLRLRIEELEAEATSNQQPASEPDSEPEASKKKAK